MNRFQLVGAMEVFLFERESKENKKKKYKEEEDLT